MSGCTERAPPKPSAPAPAAAAGFNRRAKLVGLVHIAALHLGLDNGTRKLAQLAWCGVASCADMSEGQLVDWLWELKRRGARIGIPAPAGSANCTDWQRLELERAALTLGWDGLGDARLRKFVQRTVGVDAVAFLTKPQCSTVIVGLRRWARQQQANRPVNSEQ